MRKWIYLVAMVLVAFVALLAYEGADATVIDRCEACGARRTRTRFLGVPTETSSSDEGYERWVQHVAPSHVEHAWNPKGVVMRGFGERWVDAAPRAAPVELPDLYRLLGADARVTALVSTCVAEFERDGAVSAGSRRAARELLPEQRVAR